MALYEFEGKSPVVDPEAFVHPDAVLIGDVLVGAGCYIGAGAVLRGDIGSVKIGNGSNVQENCVIHTFPGKSLVLHADTHIGHGSILHGCEIHSNVLVGMGSIISNRARINANCLIGAGTFIPAGMEIPPDSVVVGSPAKVIKKISPAQLEELTRNRGIYQDLARRYLKSFRRIP
ncbi:MAG: gamma carbonic anhydrase family protein [Proteobacteria bacterium]|nr:gamma carbonic anhydrase family protein [Pseudomonadota bacterium]